MSEDTEVERDYETEAREQGWNPDYDGPNKVDPKVFVEKGEKIAGMALKRLEKAESQITTLQESNRQFGEYHKQTLETQRKNDADKIADLEGQLAQAITDGDGANYTRLNREIKKVESQQQPNGNDAQAYANIAETWARDNTWYADDPKLRTYADGLADKLRHEGYQGEAYFSEITRRVQEDFPDSFKNPNKSKAGSVETGGQRAVQSKEGTYDSLPPDAKAFCDSFVKEGFMTREQYVETYEFDEGGQ